MPYTDQTVDDIKAEFSMLHPVWLITQWDQDY